MTYNVFMSVLTMLIAISLFLPVLLDRSLTFEQRLGLTIGGMLFFICSTIL